MTNKRLSADPSSSSLSRHFQSLSVSKRKLTINNQHQLAAREVDDPSSSSATISTKCLSLYARTTTGGCKVGAAADPASTTTTKSTSTPPSPNHPPSSDKRRSIVTAQDSSWRRSLCAHQPTSDCFPHGLVKDKFLCKSRAPTNNNNNNNNHSKHNIQFQQATTTTTTTSHHQLFLPDDILEMCLLRLPWTSLMNTRLVCKRWRHLTTTPRFMHMRQHGSHQTPWLFLFGAVKDGHCSAEIQVLDASLRQWHKVDSDFLKGRFFFSVTSIFHDIYIVGGCSSLSNFGKLDRSSFKTHKGVFVFSPLTKSSRKIASMKFARSAPILGICQVSSDCKIMQQNRQDWCFYRSRTGGVSDVYQDPHRLSLRRQQGNSSLQYDHTLSLNSSSRTRNSPKSVKQMKNDQPNTKDSSPRFVMIAVGGVGPWDEPLYSGELYDSASNKWVDIQRLPVDFGTVCSGIICNKMFYVCSEANRLAAYDVEKGFWIGIQTTPFPSRVQEYHPKLVLSNNQVFMLSVSWCEGDGEIGRRNKAVRKLWELDLVLLTWKEVSTHPDAPMDWNAGFVGDRNLIFGVEMFKIFGQVLDFFTVCDVSSLALSDVGIPISWSHISKNQVARELDASSCVTKTLAVVHF